MRRALLIAASVALAAPAAAQLDTAFASRLRRSVGERLVFDAKIQFLTVGEAEILVAGLDTIRGREAARLRFRVTGSSYVYKINTIMESWLALDSLMALRFVMDQEEGGTYRYNRYELFPEAGYYEHYRDTAAVTPDTVAPTISNPLDDAAFFFFVRTLPLEIGDRYELDRYFKPDRNPVILEVVRREVLEVPAGRFNTIVVRPTIRGNGIFKEGARGEIWLSDDPIRRVVQIRGRIGSVPLTLRLVRIERDETAPASAREAN